VANFVEEGGRMRLEHRPAQTQRQQQHQKQAARQTMEQVIEFSEQELDEELERDDLEESGAEEEPKEPPESEAVGESEIWLDDEEETDLFEAEQAPVCGLPAIGDLLIRARPLVRYWIDEKYRVHQVGQRGGGARQAGISRWRRYIAEAVAEHLRRHGCRLTAPGDWRQIPAIGSDERLLSYMPEEVRQPLQSRLKGLGKRLKGFAIELPNGDVMTVQALIDPAGRGKKATRAGALRCAAELEKGAGDGVTLAGEEWTSRDWKALDRAERSYGWRRKPAVGDDGN